MNSELINALLNTVVGMGTVFLVLIFISYIISLFKHIPTIVDKFSKKQEAPSVPTSKPIEEVPIEEESEEELVDDSELVAVITAAIMASMGEEVPSDGLQVRSIRRVNKARWQNA